MSVEGYVVERLPSYLELLATLDVPTPDPISKAALVLPEAVVDNYGTSADYERALKPALDVLWNSVSDGFFDDNGNWTGTIRAGWS